MYNHIRLRAVLRQSGLTQKKFAQKIGVSEGKLTKALQGEQQLNFDAIASLFQEFNLHPGWFFLGEGSEEEVMLLDDVVPRKRYEELKEKYDEVQEELLQNYRLGNIKPGNKPQE